MKVKIGSTYIKSRYVTVKSLKEASDVVCRFRDENDLTAGCGSRGDAMKTAEILEDGEKIATVSYNGRVWNLDQQEIKL